MRAGRPPTPGHREHSHPAWVVEELRRAVGDAELEALLVADNEPPKVTLVARPGRAERAELPGEPTPYSPYGVVLDGGRPGAVPAVAEGRAGVQDEGSQLVALAAGRRRRSTGRTRPGWTCAPGPGGKSALLAALAAERGAGLVAVERQHHRSRLVARALGRCRRRDRRGHRRRHRATAAPRLASTGCWSTRPCTGLGALRRRPEARWRRTPEDLDALVPLQRLLLAAALELVRPGGVVVYATCSPVLAETAEVVTATAAGPARRRARGRGAAAARRTRLRRPARPAPSSCGRTGTAPTRCSWPCYAVASTHDRRDRRGHRLPRRARADRGRSPARRRAAAPSAGCSSPRRRTTRSSPWPWPPTPTERIELGTSIALAFARTPMRWPTRRTTCTGCPAAGWCSASARRSSRTSPAATACRGRARPRGCRSTSRRCKAIWHSLADRRAARLPWRLLRAHA